MEPVYNERIQRRYASDRRTHIRRRLPVAELELSDSVGGSVLDLSEAGMAVQGVSRLTAQNFSKVRFRLPNSASWIETSCKVAWMSEAQDVAGVEFESLGDLERAQIRSWSERTGRPEPWVKDSAAPRRTVVMELPLSPAGASEAPMFRSESWVREPSRAPYGRVIVLLVLVAVAAAALFFAIRSGSLQRLFESGPSVGAPAASATENGQTSSADAPPAPEDSEPATPNGSAPNASDRAAIAPAPALDSTAASDQTFIVQVGAMRVRGNADALEGKLQGYKFPTIEFQGRENLNVVAVGPFQDQHSARAARDELHAKGFDAVIRKLPAR
jgi:cell division septation protein DedD